MKKIGTLASVMASLSSCAHVPPVSRTYYFPRAQQDVVVTQTLGCLFKVADQSPDEAKPKGSVKPKKPPKPLKSEKPVEVTPAAADSAGPYSTATAAVTTTYIADYTISHAIAYADFDSFAGDLDMAVGVTDDGRLSSINAAGTGEGGAIVKSAVTLASAVAAFLDEKISPSRIPQTLPAPERPAGAKAACHTVKKYGTQNDKTKALYTLTVNYKVTVMYRFAAGNWKTASDAKGTNPPPGVEEISYTGEDQKPGGKAWWGTPIPIALTAGANAIPTEDLKTLRGQFSFVAERDAIEGSPNVDPDLQPKWKNEPPSSAPASNPPVAPSSSAPTSNLPADPPETVAVPRIARLKITISGPQDDLSKVDVKNIEFYHDTILAPMIDAAHVPVPAAKWFGKIATTAQFGASGIVEKLEYNKASWLSDLMGSGTQIIGALTPAASLTTAQQAAAIQAQSDLIYQQQRLVACHLDATTCPSK